MRAAPFVAAAITAAASSSFAEERFLRIEVEGEFPAQTKTAIERAFADAEIKKARTDAGGQLTNLDQLCALKGCTAGTNSALKQHIQRGVGSGLARNPTAPIRIPGVTIDGDSFIAVPQAPIGGPTVIGPTPPPPIELIPYNAVQWANGDGPIAAEELQPAVTPTLDVISDDLQVLGQSSRQIAIPEWIDDAALASLQAAISDAGDGASTVSFSVETTPANEFALSLAQPVTFESGGNAETCEADEDWPFNASEVAEIIEFNFEVLDRMGIRRMRRSSVLIMDTGLGSGLAADPDFKRFLDTSMSEALYADTYFKDRSSFAPVSRICLDVDGLGRSSDTYGFAIEQSGSSPTGIVPISCKTHAPIERIVALEPPTGATLPAYVPEHGSFVAGLALGGPSLIAATDRIEDLIGLTFARITDAPNSVTQTIKTEVTTLEKALEFASVRRIDVLNASIRVADIDQKAELRAVLSTFDGIIVAAAGNFPQPITSSSDSFPAGVTDAAFDNRLIVVAALKKGSTDRMWENSARHRTHVDIAAPGANVTSLNRDGTPICMSGTSAAAPLVSFVAGSLVAFGVRSPTINGNRSPEEVLHRIYATAEIDENLTDVVKDGRVLDVATSLDVFVDHIWTEAAPDMPMRVLVQRADQDTSKPVILRACDRNNPGDLAASKGVLDAGVLVMWTKSENGDHANVWHRSTGSMSVEAGSETGCKPSDENVHFLDLSDNQVKSLSFSEIRRIAFSPFRKAFPTVRTLALEN